MGAVFSLACGAVVGLGIGRYAGKGQSDLGLLRALLDVFRPGDVVLADRLMCAWTEMVMLKLRGIDSVARLGKRTADFRRGKRLGPGDHVVVWPKPRKPRTIDQQAYDRLPESLTVRETRVRVEQAGFRTTALVVATTLLDAGAVTAGDLAGLYRARWNAELDLRSLKRTLQMGELRGKTPEMVRKEVWAHVLAYNLIRTVMAQAAARHDIPPRSISFTGAMQTLEAFRPLLELGPARDAADRRVLYHELLGAVAAHRVADRPDRFEPRLKQRRKDYCGWLTEPRAELKRKMANGANKK